MPTVPQRLAPGYIRDRIPFSASNLHGIEEAQYAFGLPMTGDLPEDWADLYFNQARQGVIEYTVLSYSTPIGWVVRNRWVIPKLRYSLTTTQHQGILWGAVKGWDRALVFPSEERAVPPYHYGPREGW